MQSAWAAIRFLMVKERDRYRGSPVSVPLLYYRGLDPPPRLGERPPRRRKLNVLIQRCQSPLLIQQPTPPLRRR